MANVGCLLESKEMDRSPLNCIRTGSVLKKDAVAVRARRPASDQQKKQGPISVC
jgi:hypothetical protein